MTYLRFETPKAKYILALMAHTRLNQPVTPQKADAIVFEGSSPKLKGIENMLAEPFIVGVTRHAFDHRIPVFNVDVTPAESIERHGRAVASRTLALLGHFMLPIPFRNASTAELGGMRNFMARTGAKFGRLVGDPVGNMRSAIMADRIERHVVPEVKLRPGKKTHDIRRRGRGPPRHARLPGKARTAQAVFEEPRAPRQVLQGGAGGKITKISFKVRRKEVDVRVEHFNAPLPNYPKKTREWQKQARQRLARIKAGRK